MGAFWRQVSLLQISTVAAVRLFDDSSLGFVYLDARHDYCAVSQELVSYWPKLIPGGLLAGDDFSHREYVGWSYCENGTYVVGGLIRAVQDFAREHEVQLFFFR